MMTAGQSVLIRRAATPQSYRVVAVRVESEVVAAVAFATANKAGHVHASGLSVSLLNHVHGKTLFTQDEGALRRFHVCVGYV